MTPIYLDNNATTRVDESVLAAMQPYYSEIYGNPHSVHTLGRRAHDGIEAARQEVAALLAASPAELIFTSCGTEGNALVIRGLLERGGDRRKIVATAVEHPSVLGLLGALERQGTIELQIVPVDGEGRLDLDAARRAIDRRTLLVTAMLAQNETGVIHPIEQISAIARAAGALLLVDAVQAAGKIVVDTGALGADFLTVSGHKFHAPKGVGALFVRRGLSLAPIWYGGGQELGLRSGTEPVPSIVGLGAAARIAREHLAAYGRVGELRDRLERGLTRNTEARPNASATARLPNTSSIAFERPDVSEIIAGLDSRGICVSGGAACTSGRTEPTATMRAMGRPASIRFSLSRYTTAEEIDRTIAAVGDLIGARASRPGL